MSLTHLQCSHSLDVAVGPAVEAFGFSRIMWGSSPSHSSAAPLSFADWYELARGSWAELGVEPEDLDAVFYENAKRIYGA